VSNETEANETGRTVDFYFGLSSRYSYLAHSQLAGIAERTGATFVWKPLFVPELMNKRQQNPFASAPPSGAYDVAYRLRDVGRWADHYGIPYNEIDGRLEGNRRLFSLAAVAGAALGAAEAMSRAIFKAMFQSDRRSLTDLELVELAVATGLDSRAYAEALTSPDTEALHTQHIDEAIAAGVFGAPTFVCEGHLWFGNDRLVLLEEWLRANS